MEIRKNWKDIAEKSKNKMDHSRGREKIFAGRLDETYKMCLVEEELSVKPCRGLFFVEECEMDRECKMVLR